MFAVCLCPFIHSAVSFNFSLKFESKNKLKLQKKLKIGSIVLTSSKLLINPITVKVVIVKYFYPLPHTSIVINATNCITNNFTSVHAAFCK